LPILKLLKGIDALRSMSRWHELQTTEKPELAQQAAQLWYYEATICCCHLSNSDCCLSLWLLLICFQEPWWA